MQELHLRYFHSVAKTGSLSAAAEEFHVAVSAVSRQVTNLERSLGIPLFIRRPRGMELTEAGKLLAAYALRNQLEVEGVISDMQDVMQRQEQKITLACPDGMAWHFLPRVIARFAAQHPSTRVELQVVESSRASALVKAGEVDIALTFSLAPDIGVKVLSSHNAAIRALMSQDHPLAASAVLDMASLQGYPLAMSLGGSTMRYLFDVACSLAGVKIAPSFSCDSLGAIYTMVSETPNMIALCSAISVSGKIEREGLVLKPIDEPQLALRSLQVQVMAERRLPPPVEAFLDLLQRQLEEVRH